MKQNNTIDHVLTKYQFPEVADFIPQLLKVDALQSEVLRWLLESDFAEKVTDSIQIGH